MLYQGKWPITQRGPNTNLDDKTCFCPPIVLAPLLEVIEDKTLHLGGLIGIGFFSSDVKVKLVLLYYLDTLHIKIIIGQIHVGIKQLTDLLFTLAGLTIKHKWIFLISFILLILLRIVSFWRHATIFYMKVLHPQECFQLSYKK